MAMDMPQPDSRNDGQFRYHFKKSASIHPHLKVLVVLTVDIVEGDSPCDAFHVVLGSLAKGIVHVHLSASDAWLTGECGMSMRDKATMLGTGHSPNACGLKLVLSHSCLIYRPVIIAARLFHCVRSHCKMHLIPVLSHHESQPIGQPHFIKWLNGIQVFSFQISIRTH